MVSPCSRDATLTMQSCWVVQLTDEFNHDAGRPTKPEQLEIARALRPYFEKSIPASVAARKTGFNVKTVNSLYHQWTDELIQAETPDFLARVKKNNQRALLAYDNRLAKLYAAEETIDKQIKIATLSGKSDQVDKFVRTNVKISDSIANITAAQLNLANAMPADVILDLEEKKVKLDGS